MPRLTARQQGDDLQQHGHTEHPGGGARGQRRRELLAAPSEQEGEDRRRGQRAQDRDRRTSAASEVAQAGSQLGEPTRARRRAERVAIRELAGDRHCRFRSAD
jgi:hypothetical protein